MTSMTPRTCAARIACARLGIVMGLAILGAVLICLPSAVEANPTADLCKRAGAGVGCTPGNGRRGIGQGSPAMVPHNDGLAGQSPGTRPWPAITGIWWWVESTSRKSRTKVAGPLNDELQGRHGSDVLVGLGGSDVIWGDWDPVANNTVQRDVLIGGDGNDWLYPSHGTSVVNGGAGTDYVWAPSGKGTINCGPGIDTARVGTNGAFTLRNCERIRHF